MMKQPRETYFFWIIGITAIVAGGIVSAFLARQPSTSAMWASAYLVLIVGVVQVFFGTAIADVTKRNSRLAYLICGLFNAGNALVITATTLKYAGYHGHLLVTITGSVLLVAALAVLAWYLRTARSSLRRLFAYIVIVILAISVPIGLLLAQ